jgi:hypothetical protein
MLSTTHGTPIAKTEKTGKAKPIILSIVDPDLEANMKVKKRKQKKTTPCCNYHSSKMCKKENCCRRCPYLQVDSDDYSGDYSEDEYSEYSEDAETESDEDSAVIGTTFDSKGQKLIPLPNLTNRFTEYIAGPSGSGKSTVASELAHQFHNIYPKKPIYIFSRTDSRKDPAFSKLKPIQVTVDESLVEDPIDITNEVTEGCLMIFDDCGTINNDKVRKAVEKLMADIMEVGRKLDCNIIITNHLIIANEKKLARTIMNELSMLTVFPKSGSAQQIRYALKTYWGMTSKQIEEVMQLKSRWLRISKNYPQYILWEGGAKILQ